MTNKQYAVKEYLISVSKMHRYANEELDNLEVIKALAERCNNAITEDRVQSSRKSDGLEMAVIKLIEAEKKVNEKVCKYLERYEEAKEYIEKIDDDRYRTILRERYIQELRFEEIAVNNSYDMSWVFRMHLKALDEMAKIMGDKLALKSTKKH